MKVSKLAVTMALGLSVVVGNPADAKVVIDIFQQGGNVVAAGSGTIDLTDLTESSGGPGNGPPELFAAGGLARVGAYGTLVGYPGISGPASFGPGARFTASCSSIFTCGSGTAFGVGDGGTLLETFFGYTSESTLSGSSTYDGQTIASLGLTPGRYVYTWGSGADADSLILNIGVPEPSTWTMMLIGFGGLGFAGWRARRKAAVAC
jgi:hypothetical protein